MDHVREHRSILAAAEKRLLIAIASRLPHWVTSDQLTVLALVSMVMAGPAFAAIRFAPWAAGIFVALLGINWFGDSLDGTLARVRDQQRPRYGYYVDHVIDLAGTSALMAGIAGSGLMTPATAFALLAAYALVAAETFLATHSRGTFRLSFAGFGPTELRILLALGALKVAVAPALVLRGHAYLFLDVAGLIAMAGLVAVFVTSSVRNARALFALEPLAKNGRPSPRAVHGDQAVAL